MTDIADRWKQFAHWTKVKRAAEADARKAATKLSQLEEGLLEEMVELGVSSVDVDDMKLYIHSQTWAGAEGGDYERACRALRQAGLGDLVQERFNVQTLSAWVREQQADGKSLPPPFEGAVRITERVSLRGRKK